MPTLFLIVKLEIIQTSGISGLDNSLQNGMLHTNEEE